MSRNGSGTYSLPAGNPVVTGTTISSTWANNTLSDIATALTASIANDGQTPITANLPMSTFKHTGVGNASARTDYAATGQVQDGSFIYVATVGGTADAITLTPSPAITAYVAGQTFRFIASGANTGATTVNISAVGAKNITKNGTTALAAGDIPSGAIVEIVYDGTQFQITKIKQGTASTIDTPVSAANGGTGQSSYTTGDIIYASAATTISKLGVGTATQVLTGGTNPAYGDVPIDGLTEDSTPDEDTDYLISYDDSASANKKVLLGTVLSMALSMSGYRVREGSVSNAATMPILFPDPEYADFKTVRVIVGIRALTDDVDLYIRTSSNNGTSYDSGAGEYSYALTGNASLGSQALYSGSDTKIIVSPTAGGVTGWGNAVNEGGLVELIFKQPSETTFYKIANINASIADMNSGSACVLNGTGIRLSASVVNAVQLSFSSGNITGWYEVWFE